MPRKTRPIPPVPIVSVVETLSGFMSSPKLTPPVLHDLAVWVDTQHPELAPELAEYLYTKARERSSRAE